MRRRLVAILGAIALVLVFGPFLVPVPPLEGTVAPERLADADSRFVDVGDLRIHYKEQGSGPLTFILLHGFGASVFSWREVMGPLAGYGRVIAYDRPAFGLTERPMTWSGADPYAPASQVDQLIGLMDVLGVDRAVLVGHSAGGTVAVAAALAHPDRVRALVLVDAAVYSAGAPAVLRPLLATPEVRRLCPLLVRQIQTWGVDAIRLAWHDPSAIAPSVIDGYKVPLRANDWDRALCALTTADQQVDLAARLHEIAMPTLVITGDDDRIVPTTQSRRLASDIDKAELVVVPDCGHLPQEERPTAFIRAVADFATRR